MESLGQVNPNVRQKKNNPDANPELRDPELANQAEAQRIAAKGPKQINQIGSQSNQQYRGDLQTDFQGRYDSPGGNFNSYQNDSDADVRHAQEMTSVLSQARAGLNPGVDSNAVAAQLSAIKARIGIKNSLGQAIGSNDAREGQSEDILRGEAGDALNQGVKNTNQNYNSRGLLYSGMREHGVNDVKSGVASNLASGLAGTKQEYSNLKSKQQQAYASVGQAQQAEQVALANQTFETVNQNNIARQQAYQQLAGGVGQVAGMMYGGKSSSTSAPAGYNNPSSYSQVNSSTLSMPQQGSQQYGLLK